MAATVSSFNYTIIVARRIHNSDITVPQIDIKISKYGVLK